MTTLHWVSTKFGGHIPLSLTGGFPVFGPATTNRYSGFFGERRLMSLRKYQGLITAHQCLVARKKFARPEGLEPPTF
jgi:hypothetical protein